MSAGYNPVEYARHFGQILFSGGLDTLVAGILLYGPYAPQGYVGKVDAMDTLVEHLVVDIVVERLEDSAHDSMVIVEMVNGKRAAR